MHNPNPSIKRDGFAAPYVKRYALQEKTLMNYFFLALVAFTMTSCATQGPSGDRMPIDQVPMYGGMDRSAFPDLKTADEKLISDTTQHYGSREAASSEFAQNGRAYYDRGDLTNAMRRFNQAWLLNPKNAEAFAGFGKVLHNQEKYCESMRMMEQALNLNPPTSQGIYPDAARITTLCAVKDKTLPSETKSELLKRSEEIYKKAEEIESNKLYFYSSWAAAYYWRGQYEQSWSMVAKVREAGGTVNEQLLRLLREKMPEPALK